MIEYDTCGIYRKYNQYCSQFYAKYNCIKIKNTDQRIQFHTV